MTPEDRKREEWESIAREFDNLVQLNKMIFDRDHWFQTDIELDNQCRLIMTRLMVLKARVSHAI